MNGMTSNPHFVEAAKHRPQLVTEETANESYVAEEGITDETMQFSALNRIAEATLALAFEQRTANMIALASIDPSWYGSTSPGEFATIAARMSEAAK